MGPPITSATDLQSTNKVATSIAPEETGNVPEYCLDSSENQGNTDEFPISDVIVPIDRGINSTNAPVESIEELEMPPNMVAINIHTLPRQRALDRLIGEDDTFEDGYDSDGKLGPLFQDSFSSPMNVDSVTAGSRKRHHKENHKR